MSISRRYIAAAASLSCGALLALAACSDDDPVSAGPDASTTPDAAPEDTSTPVTPDAGAVDARPPLDATTVDAADSGPLVTEDVRSTAFIRVGGDFAFATFSEDDTVLTWPAHPDCIAIARSSSKPYSAAGTVTIGGQIVGKDGGPAGPVELTSTTDYFASDTFFAETDQFSVDVTQGPATPAFPALSVQTLPPSRAGAVVVTKPVVDAGAGAFDVPAGGALELAWTVPDAGASTQKVIIDLAVGATETPGSKDVQIYCGVPIAAGKLVIPNDLIRDVKERTGTTGPTTAVSATLTLFAGGFKIVPVTGATYIIAIAREESTNFPAGTTATFR